MTPTTNHMHTDSSPGPQHSAGNGVTGTAREEAGQLKETSADAARQVAGTMKEKASDVTSDVRQQTQRLAGQTRNQLVDQASQQKERATQSLRSMSGDLRGMSEHGESGLGAQLAQHGARFTDQAADFLQQHEPGDLLEEFRGYARRKPGTFRWLQWPRALWRAASRAHWPRAAPMRRAVPRAGAVRRGR